MCLICHYCPSLVSAASLTRNRLAKDPKKYSTFWDQYSANIKYGMLEDNDNKIRLSKLLRFHSSQGPEWTSLEDYVGRMKKGQEEIYYLAGESREAVEKSPIVERLLKRGYEVIFCEDPLDEVRARLQCATQEFVGACLRSACAGLRSRLVVRHVRY